MLELSREQELELLQHEYAGFVARVRLQIVRDFPDVDHPDLQDRLERAHRHALRLGLESANARTQFLYQEAFAPGFYESPAIVSWLGRPGSEPEQRWSDFVSFARSRIEDL